MGRCASTGDGGGDSGSSWSLTPSETERERKTNNRATFASDKQVTSMHVTSAAGTHLSLAGRWWRSPRHSTATLGHRNTRQGARQSRWAVHRLLRSVVGQPSPKAPALHSPPHRRLQPDKINSICYKTPTLKLFLTFKTTIPKVNKTKYTEVSKGLRSMFRVKLTWLQYLSKHTTNSNKYHRPIRINQVEPNNSKTAAFPKIKES